MGFFWEYFRDTLRLPFIQRPGPLAMLADGGATALDTAREIALQLRDQFFPDRCEEAYLVRFARSRGIVRGQMEPEASFFGRVRLAYLWHLQGGRDLAMQMLLVDLFGFYSAEVINLRAEYPERWAEFRVVCDVGVNGNPLVLFEQMEWAINESKPARSRLAQISMVVTVETGVPVYSFATITTETVDVPEVTEIVIELLRDEETGAILYDEISGNPLYYVII